MTSPTESPVILQLREALETIRGGLSEKGPRVIADEALKACAIAASPVPGPILTWQERLLRNGNMGNEHVFMEAEISDLRAALAAVPGKGEPAQHFDDHAVDCFAKMMKEKLAKKRAQGRSGWDDPEQCSISYLKKLFHESVQKGDPVDVANFCMMLRHHHTATTTPDFDVWQESPYTKVLQKSIADDYVPRFAAPVVPVDRNAVPAIDKENAVQQAQIWAQEARSQRATVLGILKALGLPEQDYNAERLVLSHVGAMRAAFHVNMLRAFPDKSHAEIAAEIDKAVGLALPAAQGEAVAYQYRTRADWHKNWTAWEDCTEGQYADRLAAPLVNDWHYEVRALGVIATSQQPADQQAEGQS